MRRFALLAGLLAALSLAAAGTLGAGEVAGPCPGGLLPDLRTIVPQQLQLVNPVQREVLRFTTAIANFGEGPLQVDSAAPLADPAQPVPGLQTVFDPHGNAVCSVTVPASFVFDPEHNHWHASPVARYALLRALDDGTGGQAGGLLVEGRKRGFCLIDVVRYRVDPNERPTYRSCGASQGISVGWADQYNQAIPGQQIDITGTPPGIYYLFNTTNPEGALIEQDTTNNTAWVSFRLTRDSSGNPKIEEVADSGCPDPDLCPRPSNR